MGGPPIGHGLRDNSFYPGVIGPEGKALKFPVKTAEERVVPPSFWDGSIRPGVAKGELVIQCYYRVGLRSSGAVTAFALFLSLATSAVAGEIATGSFSKITATTTQTIVHGLSETPKAVIFFTTHSVSEASAQGAYFALGFADGTSEYSVAGASEHGVAANTSSRVAAKAITIVQWGEATVAEADLTAWDSTDFTLDWTTNDGNASVVHFIAFGGSDISAKVQTWNGQGSTGNQSITGVGFEPTVAFHMYSYGLSADSSGSFMDQSFGLMEATGGEWACATIAVDAASTTDTSRSHLSNACLIDINAGGGSSFSQGSFASMDSDGFTINWSLSNSQTIHTLALEGVNAHAGVFNKSTSTSVPVSQSITGIGFQPDLLLLSSIQAITDGNGRNQARRGLGATDGTTEGCVTYSDRDGQSTSTTNRISKTSKAFVKIDNNGQNIDAEADLASFDSDGFTLSWTTNDAVATEVSYLALVPFSAVSVSLSTLAATTAYPTGTEVSWRTEKEVDNVGFHIYRQRGPGPRTRVTRRQIAGSALLVTRGTTLTSTQRYSWYDRDGQWGDRYWVEDYDLNGSTQLHGPVVAQQAASGQQMPCAPAPVASASTASGSGSAFTPTNPRFADPSSMIDPTIAAWLAARAVLWVEVECEGWVRVTYGDWVAAGLPTTAPASLLQLYYRGVEYAIEIEGDADGVFGPGDAVTFYGLGLDTLDTAAAAYALTIGNTPGKRISQSTASSSATPLNSLLHTVVEANETQYFAALRNGETDNFFGDLVTETSLTCFVATPHHDTNSAMPVSLEVSLQGLGAAEHDVAISANGVDVGTATFTGIEHATTAFDLPPPIRGSTLEVTLTTSGGNDFAFLDAIAVTYPRNLSIGDEFFRCLAPGSSALLLSEALPGTRVFDSTDPSDVVELVTSSVPSPGGPTVEITVSLPGGGERIWVAVPPNTYVSPTKLRANTPSGWRSKAIDADFIIIAPGPWLEALRPLAQRRRKEGLSCLLVAVEDLYDEWNGGMRGSEPIAQFLREAARPPTYLLLVGDTTYDPRERLPGTTASVLPTRLIDSARLETASDQWFGDLDQDGIAEIAVGRLPAQVVEDVERYVKKVLAYAEMNLAGGTSSQSLVVTDDDDSFPFGAAGSLAQTLLSQSMSVTLVDRNILSVADARDQIESALNTGVAIATYFGHGGTGGWGAEDLLTTAQVQTIGNPTAWPIVISSSCLNGFFHHRLSETLGEAWLLGSAGAVAVWGSTSLSNPYPQRELTLAILNELVGGSSVRLGDAFLAAQGAADPGTLRITVLLGDPTVVFNP